MAQTRPLPGQGVFPHMQTRDISGVLITGTRNGRYSVFQIEVLNNGEWQTAVIASI